MTKDKNDKEKRKRKKRKRKKKRKKKKPKKRKPKKGSEKSFNKSFLLVGLVVLALIISGVSYILVFDGSGDEEELDDEFITTGENNMNEFLDAVDIEEQSEDEISEEVDETIAGIESTENLVAEQHRKIEEFESVSYRVHWNETVIDGKVNDEGKHYEFTKENDEVVERSYYNGENAFIQREGEDIIQLSDWTIRYPYNDQVHVILPSKVGSVDRNDYLGELDYENRVVHAFEIEITVQEYSDNSTTAEYLDVPDTEFLVLIDDETGLILKVIAEHRVVKIYDINEPTPIDTPEWVENYR